MAGRDDFRPEPRHHASDPSLEEMLRRARDAHLGDADGTTPWQQPTLRPFTEPPLAWLRSRVLSRRVIFLAGMMVGVLLMYLVVRAGVLASTAVPQTQPAAQSAPATATSVPPTPTDAQLPTPTDVPTATATPTVVPLPGSDEIIRLAQQYFDTQSALASTDIFVYAPAAVVQSQEDTQLTACITYQFAAVSSPNTLAGTETRLFTLTTDSDGTWQVVAMGDEGSCSLG